MFYGSISDKNTSFLPFTLTAPNDTSVNDSAMPAYAFTDPILGEMEGFMMSNLLVWIIYCCRVDKLVYLRD